MTIDRRGESEDERLQSLAMTSGQNAVHHYQDIWATASERGVPPHMRSMGWTPRTIRALVARAMWAEHQEIEGLFT